jgi:ribonuclease HI
MSHVIRAYTDGACKGNPGPGGWGVVLQEYDSLNTQFKGRSKTLSGKDPETTNNKMELQAPIEALEALKGEGRNIIIYTDSKYVQNGITSWIKNWKKNGWKTANKQDVKNKNLWVQLESLVDKHHVTWEWVKGHSGNPGNEQADQLATGAIEY